MAISLSQKESELLGVVIAEMNGVPDVDFEVVAQKVGIKYARNARSSFKRIWDKLKGGETGTDDNDKKTTPKKSTPKKASTRVTKPTAGKGNKTPSKSPGKKKRQVKKEESDEGDDEINYDKLDVKDEEDEESSTSEEDDFNEDTKMKEEDDTDSTIKEESGEVDIKDESDDGEEFEAATRDMTVEELRLWKAQNNYDTFRAVTPGYDYEV
ncbi:hypothetical protein F5884DRAFT_826944 [Xylogone sp. PMI_703]|nr:hypothetical protein F5884DRAFT_826944 [Xylogone sp. PMI_703]